MNLDALFAVFEEAHKLSKHREFVVVGSLSILGLEGHFDIPESMTLSNDIGCFTKTDPDRIYDVVKALGENSEYHQKSGYYLDAVAPGLPTLPDGWADRLILVERGGLLAWFLDPNDAALSKYARGEPRDRRWIQAGILAGVVSLPIVRSRLRSVIFLDHEEQEKSKALIASDVAWFELVMAKRSPG